MRGWNSEFNERLVNEIFVFVKVNSGRIRYVVYGCRLCLIWCKVDLVFLCMGCRGIVKVISILVIVVWILDFKK